MHMKTTDDRIYELINKMNIKEGNSSLLNYFFNSNTKHVLYYFRAVQYWFKTLDRIPINKEDGESISISFTMAASTER